MVRRTPLARRAMHAMSLVTLATATVAGVAAANAATGGTPPTRPWTASVSSAAAAGRVPYDTRGDALSDGAAPEATSSTTPSDTGTAGTAGTAPVAPGQDVQAALAIAPHSVPVGGRPGLTPGHGTHASQITGNGYVDTRLENRFPGTPGWKTTRRTRRHMIEGFASATSAVAGDDVRVFVSATAPTFRIQLLRIGWYGGVGARSVWLSDPVRGGLQRAALEDPTTRMITAPWHVSATMPTEGLVAGDYLLKLLGSDGASSFVPLVVREPHSTGAVLMLNSTLTWLAYNPWGGANTYKASDGDDDDEEYAERSVIASYDRPYGRGSGTGGFLEEEYQLVLTAERLGLKLNYAADVDLHAGAGVLSGANAVALLGHSEYWSRQMRAALTTARDGGTNLAFFGANDIFRRIRLQPSSLGPQRQMVNYKDGAEDPDKSEDTTADWTKPPFKNPAADVVGVQYRCAKARADMVVTDPNGWLFAGLGLKAGQKLPGLVGSEFDRVVLGVPTPRPIQIMAHSPISCYGYPEFSDLVWYSTASGAGAFAAGTLDWNVALAAPDRLTRTVVTTVTERVFKTIAQPLAGRTIPAVDNAARYYSPSGVPLDAHGRPLTVPAPSAKPNAEAR